MRMVVAAVAILCACSLPSEPKAQNFTIAEETTHFGLVCGNREFAELLGNIYETSGSGVFLRAADLAVRARQCRFIGEHHARQTAYTHVVAGWSDSGYILFLAETAVMTREGRVQTMYSFVMTQAT